MRVAKSLPVIAVLCWVSWTGAARAELPEPIPPEQFAALHRLIRPQPGELRFHDIPWLIDVWEARKKAAAEGKPILVWSGAGGSPLGVC
jgi:hypothetical protein